MFYWSYEPGAVLVKYDFVTDSGETMFLDGRLNFYRTEFFTLFLSVTLHSSKPMPSFVI